MQVCVANHDLVASHWKCQLQEENLSAAMLLNVCIDKLLVFCFIDEVRMTWCDRDISTSILWHRDELIHHLAHCLPYLDPILLIIDPGSGERFRFLPV